MSQIVDSPVLANALAAATNAANHGFDGAVLFSKRFFHAYNLVADTKLPPMSGWKTAALKLRDDALVAKARKVIDGEIFIVTLTGRGWELLIAHLVAVLAMLPLAKTATRLVYDLAMKENRKLHAGMVARARQAGSATPAIIDIGGVAGKYERLANFLLNLKTRTLVDALDALSNAIETGERPTRAVKLLREIPTEPSYITEDERARQTATLRLEAEENF